MLVLVIALGKYGLKLDKVKYLNLATVLIAFLIFVIQGVPRKITVTKLL